MRRDRVIEFSWRDSARLSFLEEDFLITAVKMLLPGSRKNLVGRREREREKFARESCTRELIFLDRVIEFTPMSFIRWR